MLIAKTNELPYFLFTIKRNIFAKRVSKLIESTYSVLISHVHTFCPSSPLDIVKREAKYLRLLSFVNLRMNPIYVSCEKLSSTFYQEASSCHLSIAKEVSSAKG